MRPRTSHPAVVHRRTVEFLYVLGGSARADIGRKTCLLREGSFAFMPRGVAHRFVAGKKGVRALVIFMPAFDLDRPDVAPVET
ncbi:MAG: cupin domain-containing protein [Elusimicrobia bacterium]|nr:cupin domain-containing protein [Elusimicrobiota bacterium]